MKTKILYAFHVSGYGGGALCLLNLIKELNKDLFHPIVLLKSWGPICSDLESLGATVVIDSSLTTVPYNASIWRVTSLKLIFGMAWSMPKFWRRMRGLDADIIHLNTMMMYPYLIPSVLNRKKTVIHVREYWPSNRHRFQFRFARYIIRKLADQIVAINSSSAEMINVPKKTEVIYDWIDFRGREDDVEFSDALGFRLKDLKIYLFLGGLQQIKGALDVVTVFCDHIKDPKARLLVVGVDSKQYSENGLRGHLKRIMRAMQIFTYGDKVKSLAQSDERVIFMPATKHVRAFFKSAYCTIACPKVQHAIIPIAESISLQTPVLAARTSESLEYSMQGQGAIMFDMNSNEDFIRQFKYVDCHEEEVREKASLASRFVSELFSRSANSERMNELYARMTEK